MASRTCEATQQQQQQEQQPVHCKVAAFQRRWLGAEWHLHTCKATAWVAAAAAVSALEGCCLSAQKAPG
jgi:hypothetical protein